MKKTYLMAASILFGAVSIAQVATNATANLTKEMNGSSVVNNNIRPSVNDDRTVILWADDCSAAGNWTFTNTSTPALDWSIEMSPAAIPVGDLSPMMSTTAANGYLFINSDGIAGNADADNTPVIVEATTAAPINLTGEANVNLQFSHNYRWWQEDRIVRVSGDNGVTWTDYVITDNSGYDLGYSSGLQNSNNPQLEDINISAVAGGQSQVKIQFYYNDNDFWGWYWAIDDVQIIRTEDDDVEVKSTYFGSVGATGTFYDYHMIPTSQIAPITFSSNVKNIGLLDQTNVTLNVDVNSGGLALASAPITSVVGVTDSLTTTAAYTPAASLGTSTFDLSITADQVDASPLNNAIESQSVEVTDYTYGRDDNTEVGSIANVTDNTGSPMSIGNVMSIFGNGLIGALDIKITSTATNENGIIYGAIYLLNDAGDGYDWLAQTDDYTVTGGDLDQFIKLVFENPVNVSAGQELLVVAGHYGDDVRFSSAQPALSQSVLGYTNDGLFNLTGANVIMIRTDMRDFTGVEDINNFTTSVNAYPNPASKNVNINYTIAQSSVVSVNVTTITGEVVYSNNLGTVNAGEYTDNINAESMANGVYFYTLTVNGENITKKLVISKK